MSFLIEIASDNYYSSPYAGGGVLLNLLCGYAAAQITSNKGYGWNYILGNFFFGLLLCGPLAVLSALTLKDLRLEQRLQDLARGESERAWQQTQASTRQARELSRQREQARQTEELQQVRCYRCGSMNAAELIVCWHCGLDFNGSEESSESAPEPELIAKDVGVVESLKPRPIRVECRECSKRFSGPKGKIQMLKACPKCGKSPFDYRQLPS